MAAAQRSCLELLGQQLPPRQQASEIRYPLLEQRLDAASGEVPRANFRYLREQTFRTPGCSQGPWRTHRSFEGHVRQVLCRWVDRSYHELEGRLWLCPAVRRLKRI